MDAWAGHTPVLREQVVALLSPAGRSVLVDCTVGLGGHSEALLQAAGPQAMLVGLDADEANLALAKQRLAPFGARVRLFHANFSQLPEVLAQAELPAADALLADLGVSSTQLDDPQRGFSFSAEAPLDMRMDLRIRRNAADLVNTMGEKALADLIYTYGEERYSRRIAAAIVEARRQSRIVTTTQLAAIVSAAYPAVVRRARHGVHPATRTFQALRIAINEEMENLDRLLQILPQTLAKTGRAAIISFHSLEDRRVKQAFAAWTETGRARLLTKKPVTADPEETQRNPRSRSAKLRGLERVA